MKKTEGIDCVELKRQVQAKLARSQAGRSLSALNASAARRMAADPHLRRLLESASLSMPMKKAG